jgi:prepilin-type N-terminal cleavage/methylation domain-containing protein
MTKINKKYLKDIAGFTFMELMVVIAIVGVLSAISLPVIFRSLPEKRLKSAARDVHSALQKGRLLAVKRNRSVAVEFDYGANPSFVIEVQKQAADASYSDDQLSFSLSDYGGVDYGTADAVTDWDGNALPATPSHKLLVTFTKTGTVNTAKTGTVDAADNVTPGTFPVSIYLDNEQQDVCYGVFVEIHGSPIIRRYSNGGWQE